MRRALKDALHAGWRAFVIVSHSFELVRGRARRGAIAPDRLVVRRFDELCAFLASHRDLLPTSGFRGLDPKELLGAGEVAPLRMPASLTAARLAQQLFRRVADRA